MDEVVRDYDDDDPHGVSRISAPIDGTAFFPGGHGLWRGVEPHGALPNWFPENSVMFVGHNFDSLRAYEQSLKRGIESVEGTTWRKLRTYVALAGFALGDCFFTNALMGLQPNGALGALKTTDRFRFECREFLPEQIDTVRPRAVVALGPVADDELRHVRPSVPILALMHPYATIRSPGLAEAEGIRLRSFLAGV